MLLREGFDLNTSNVINKPKVKGGSLITPKDLNTSNVINKPCQKIKLNLKILYLNTSNVINKLDINCYFFIIKSI